MTDPVLGPEEGPEKATYLADARGNFLTLGALFIPVMLLALGAAVDYTSASRRTDTLNGVADAAALVATTPAMMTESCSSQTSATCLVVKDQMARLFNAQAALVQGVSAANDGSTTPVTIAASNITITDSTTTPLQRTATVNWASYSVNYFAGVLAMPTMAIGGYSTAKNSNAPVTTFYMLIDNSPSMAFPSTSSGVTTMINSTPDTTTGSAGSCALGCHESSSTAYNNNNPSNVTCLTGASGFSAGTTYFPCVTKVGGAYGVGTLGKTTNCDTASKGKAQTIGAGTFKGSKYYGAEDYFALSRCLAVELRVDAVNKAVAALMTTAPATGTANNTTYAVQIYSLDHGDNNIPDTYTTLAPAHTPSTVVVGLYPVYYWGCSSSTPTCGTPDSPATIEAQSNSTMTTDFTTASTVATANLLPEETCSPGTTKCGSTSWGTGVKVGATNYYQTSSSQDDDTQIDQYGLAGMYALMPKPGNGGATSTPQEVLFIVTDGVNDSAGSSPSNGCVGSTNPPGPYYSRHLFCVNQLTNAGTGNDYCTDIKAKGIRIAFLYLRYNGLNPYDGAQPGYTSDVEPWQYPGDSTRTDNNFAGDTDEIEQAAIACASSGLEFTVDTDTDITTAMNGLFQKAVQTAYLAH